MNTRPPLTAQQCHDIMMYGTAIEKQLYDDKFNGVWITKRVDPETFTPTPNKNNLN